jgi:hypothetical protein
MEKRRLTLPTYDYRIENMDGHYIQKTFRWICSPHKETLPNGLKELLFHVDESGLEPLEAISKDLNPLESKEWYEDPLKLARLSIYLVNISLLRRFHPFVTVLTNDPQFEDYLPSAHVNYVRVPIHFDGMDGDFSHSEESPSFFIQGGKLDPFWMAEEIMWHVMVHTSFVTPLHLLSQDEVDLESLKALFDQVEDFDGMTVALAEVFPVIVSYGHIGPLVITKDPEVLSYLESHEGESPGEDGATQV